jgi:hypothetical protein
MSDATNFKQATNNLLVACFVVERTRQRLVANNQWDEYKAQANLKKYKVDFADAVTILKIEAVCR